MTATAFARCSSAWVWRVALTIALPSVAACQFGHRHTLSPEEQARWQHDSAQYVQDSVKWVRDSIVRDSIGRTVNTDSLYHLYRRMLVASDPAPIMFLVNCERGRLTWQYGVDPAIAAMTRMGDTLWQKSERAEANRMWDKISNMSVEQMAAQGVSPNKCGWPRSKMPQVYNGTDLAVVASRPRPPKRP